MSQFNWTDPGELVDDDLMLLLAEKSPADPSKGYVPTYKFEMRLVGTPEKIGNIDLRVGETERLRMYGGQLAYGSHQIFEAIAMPPGLVGCSCNWRSNTA